MVGSQAESQEVNNALGGQTWTKQEAFKQSSQETELVALHSGPQ